MAGGEQSAQEPTPVFDAVVASVRAAAQAQPEPEGEEQGSASEAVAAV
ncbi:hypothetical protein [Amycolatopsis alkalitolerans]|nr:hypothetical protein [Amycolatopsis alkalitolerans]